MSGRRVIVTGGRDYAMVRVVRAVLDSIHREASIGTVVTGACPTGADALACDWAMRNGLSVEEFPADWATHGRAAGPVRNARMVRAGADLMVAFPGGRGTADCVRKAEVAGIQIQRVLTQYEARS